MEPFSCFFHMAAGSDRARGDGCVCGWTPGPVFFFFFDKNKIKIIINRMRTYLDHGDISKQVHIKYGLSR